MMCFWQHPLTNLYPLQVDVYGFGVIMWELATRDGYFSEVNLMSVRILSLSVLLGLGRGAHWRAS
jgi:hypothetical protein